MASIFFNGGTDGRSINRGGHSGLLIYGGRGMVYRYAMSGKWNTVSTFGSTEGNRNLVIARNARYWNLEQMPFNGNGLPVDSTPSGTVELLKLEGRDNCIGDSVLLDSIQQGVLSESGDWTPYNSGNRICHSVFQNLGGPFLYMRDNLDDGSPGNERISDFQIKNCIIDRVAQNERTGWEDHLIVAYMSTGQNWRNAISMHGVTIRDTRTSSQLYITIERGTSPANTQTLAWFLANEPANFSNITVTSSSLFTSERTLNTSIMPSAIPTYFTPNTTGNGVPLTTVAAGDAGSGTTLLVNDARWFVDPRYGTSPTIHCASANRTYTAINKATGAITVSSGFSRSPGDPVHRGITSGSNPNRGAVR